MRIIAAILLASAIAFSQTVPTVDAVAMDSLKRSTEFNSADIKKHDKMIDNIVSGGAYMKASLNWQMTAAVMVLIGFTMPKAAKGSSKYFYIGAGFSELAALYCSYSAADEIQHAREEKTISIVIHPTESTSAQ